MACRRGVSTRLDSEGGRPPASTTPPARAARSGRRGAPGAAACATVLRGGAALACSGCRERRPPPHRRRARVQLDTPFMTTLVLLPGMDGTGALFDPLVEALAGTIQVKVVRYPLAAPAGYAELERFAEASLPGEGPLILLGESFSGPIAISLAANHSERVRGLILCCTFARNPYPALSLLKHLMRLVPFKLVPTHIAEAALLGRFATPKLRTALSAALAGVSSIALQSRLKAVLAVDAAPAMGRVGVPILYLRASEDRVVPDAAGDFIRSIQPAAHMVQISGPHCLLQAAPRAAASAIQQFVQAVG